jgi:hypothetical protein
LRPQRSGDRRVRVASWGRLVGADRLAELGAGLVAALPVVVGAGEGLARRLAAGRAEGCARAHAAGCSAKQELGAPPRSASIGTVWCYGDLDIGRVPLPPWSRERGNHWDRGTESSVVLGANRRVERRSADQREPVSSPRRPRRGEGTRYSR